MRDEAATFREVFEANMSYVWRVLRRLGVDRADVADVCQEVFLVVHKKREQAAPGPSLRAWIYGICLRKASEHRRRVRVHREDEAIALFEASIPPTQHEDFERKRALAQLERAVARLDDDKRAAFVLYEIEELTLQEVAHAMGCPLQTAYSRLMTARKSIEAEMRRSVSRRIAV